MTELDAFPSLQVGWVVPNSANSIWKPEAAASFPPGASANRKQKMQIFPSGANASRKRLIWEKPQTWQINVCFFPWLCFLMRKHFQHLCFVVENLTFQITKKMLLTFAQLSINQTIGHPIKIKSFIPYCYKEGKTLF